MKKYILYIAILALGLILGYAFFGNSSEGSSSTKDVSDMSENAEAKNQMWTCSMHPQIMKDEPGDCPICGMDLIPAEINSDGLTPNEIRMTENAMALANIQTNIVGNATGNSGRSLQLSGKIMANEEANMVQASYFEGRIEKLHINYTGEEVKLGQLLATLYSPALVAAQQELITAASLKNSQGELYSAVRNKLKLLKLTEAQINQIEKTGKAEENFPIYATVSGTVVQKMVEEGDYVKQGQPMVKVNNLKTVWGMFDAYENQISQLKKGLPIAITTNAYPDNKFEAVISFIDPILNTTSRIVGVRATMANENGLLKPGMFVSGEVEISSDDQPQSITVPSTAVLWTGSRSLVYVKTNPIEPVFEMREVTLGAKIGNIYTITDGLFNGEEVVSNGTFTVDAAAQLQGKKSMMNKAGGKTQTGHEGHVGSESIPNNAQGKIGTLAEGKDVPLKFQQELREIFNKYVIIRDALVNDNADLAKKTASELQNSLDKIEPDLLSASGKMHWNQLKKELNKSAFSIGNTINIEDQREHFIHLSAHLIKAIKDFGINLKVYVDFCPMANNNKGAYWLSEQTDISNPYFGQDMLTCGSITEEIN